MQSTGPTNNLLLNFAAILYLYKSFTRNTTITTEYCLAQWISNLSRSFEIHWVRAYLVNCMDSVGIVNTIVYKTKPTFTGSLQSKLWKHWYWFVECWCTNGWNTWSRFGAMAQWDHHIEDKLLQRVWFSYVYEARWVRVIPGFLYLIL